MGAERLADGELLIVFLCLGCARRAFETFVFLLIASLPGGSTQLMGLATCIQTISEIPAYWYFKNVSDTIGTRGVLYVSVACYLIRALVYSSVTVAWPLLLVEPLHGITFALLFSNVVIIAAEVSPKGLEGTAQGVLTRGFFEGLGVISGSVAGGLLFDASPQMLFGAVAVLVVFTGCVMGATDVTRAYQKSSRRRRSVAQSSVSSSLTASLLQGEVTIGVS